MTSAQLPAGTPTQASGPEPFWFPGGRVRTVIPGPATGGAMLVLEFSDPLGRGPPMHVHGSEDELWSCSTGEVSVFVGETRRDLVAGEVAVGPRGTPHSYLVRSAVARLAAARRVRLAQPSQGGT